MPRKRSRVQEDQDDHDEQERENQEEVAPVALPAEVLRQQKRKLAQRGVVERRAAHFARAQPSSTPTGWVSTSSATPTNTAEGDASTEQKEAWCGPFATAHRLLHQREQAKAKREKRIMDEANGIVYASDDENEIDGDAYLRYDNYVANFRTGGKKEDFTILPPPLSRRVKSLVEISLHCLAEHFDAVEDLGENANADHRATLGHLLSSRRRLTNEAVQLLALQGSSSLILPECSMVSQDALINAIKKSATLINENENNEGEETIINTKFTNLQLDNCGFALSDQTIEAITPYVTHLEILKATGCYRCNDTVMANFIKEISKTLKHLDVSNNSRFAQEFMTALVENCQDTLESLKMDHSLQINGKIIQELVCFQKLQSLSISHIQDVNDDDISVILKGIGKQLRSISCAGCFQLTDQTLVNMRENCREMQEIDLSSIPNLTKIGLMGLFMESKDEISIGGSLHTIKLNNLSSSVDDDVIIALSQLSSRSLAHLEIGGCIKVGNRSIAALKIHCSTCLRYLDLSFVRKIYENIVVALVKECPSLTDLHIWGCSQMNVATFSSFFSGNINQ